MEPRAEFDQNSILKLQIPSKQTGKATATYGEEWQYLMDIQIQRGNIKQKEIPAVPPNSLNNGICTLNGLREFQEDAHIKEKIPTSFLKLSKKDQEDILRETLKQKVLEHKDEIHAQSTACAIISWVTYHEDKSGILHIRAANIGDSHSFYQIVDSQGELDYIKKINKTTEDSIGKFTPFGGGKGELAAPEINTFDVKFKPNEKAFTLVCCDGTFEDLCEKHSIESYQLKRDCKDKNSPELVRQLEALTQSHLQEHYNAIKTCYEKKPVSLDHFIYRLGTRALQAGSSDNITIVASETSEIPELSAVFDGAGRPGNKVSTLLGATFLDDLVKNIFAKIKSNDKHLLQICDEFQNYCIEFQAQLMNKIVDSLNKNNSQDLTVLRTFILDAQQFIKDKDSPEAHSKSFRQLQQDKKYISDYFIKEFKPNNKNKTLILDAIKKYNTAEKLLEPLQSIMTPSDKLGQFIPLFYQEKEQLDNHNKYRIRLLTRKEKSCSDKIEAGIKKNGLDQLDSVVSKSPINRF